MSERYILEMVRPLTTDAKRRETFTLCPALRKTAAAAARRKQFEAEAAAFFNALSNAERQELKAAAKAWGEFTRPS